MVEINKPKGKKLPPDNGYRLSGNSFLSESVNTTEEKKDGHHKNKFKKRERSKDSDKLDTKKANFDQKPDKRHSEEE